MIQAAYPEILYSEVLPVSSPDKGTNLQIIISADSCYLLTTSSLSVN